MERVELVEPRVRLHYLSLALAEHLVCAKDLRLTSGGRVNATVAAAVTVIASNILNLHHRVNPNCLVLLIVH